MLIPVLAVIAAIGLLALAYARFIEPSWLRIRHLLVPVEGWPPSSAGLCILHLSDLHIGRSTQRMHRFIARAAAVPADIVVITGDFVDHPRHVPELVEALRPITAGTRPVLAVLGNHDRFAYPRRIVRTRPDAYDAEPLIQAIRSLGIDLLIDERRQVPTRVGDVTIAGIDIRSHNAEGVARAMDGQGRSGVVMLAHSPDALPAAADAKITLLLCGHTHGGQVRVGPWFTPMTSTVTPLRPPSGLNFRGGIAMHVSPGLGTTFLPLRFFARPEATLVELVPPDQSEQDR